MRDTVLSLFRRLSRRVGSLPAERRADALGQLRQGFRANVHVTDPAEVAKLVQHASSKLAYLRMITPTLRGELGEGAGTYVFRDGRMQQGRAGVEAGARYSAYDATNLDPESLSRHHRLVERQHFGRRGPR